MKMKQIVSLVLFTVTVFGMFPQKITTKELHDMAMEAHYSSLRAKRNNNIDSAIMVLTNFIRIYDSSPRAVRDSVKYLKLNRLSALTPLYCMKNNRKKALETFRESVNYGYDNYYEMADPVYNIIKDDPYFANYRETLKEEKDFRYILANAAEYCHESKLPEFKYMPANDTNLVKIRKHFNLDSVAGNGDELSKIKNLLSFVHNLVRHDGQHRVVPAGSIELVDFCNKNGSGLNCRFMAHVLNEFYLAMGFKSRYVTCMPKVYISDCHVINAVWSDTLKKWLWVDPTFDAFVADENGTMLSIQEVRERLRKNEPLVLNDYANWNNKNKQTKEYYLEIYMAKNLYILECNVYSGYNPEAEGKDYSFVGLYPTGFEPYNKIDYKTSNVEYFWQAPE